MRREAQTNSVRSLERLYSTVVGLALSLALLRVIAVERDAGPIRWDLLPLFFAYLVTLIPFYHGALRHLDSTYVEHGGREVRPGALLLDFVMLFLESCLLFTMAALLPSARLFSIALLALLSFDAVWGFVAWTGLSQRASGGAELRWSAINAVAAAALFAVLGLIGAFGAGGPMLESPLRWVLPSLCWIRTLADYAWCWAYYYPSA